MTQTLLAQTSVQLPAVDIAVIVVYILGIVVFGACFYRRSKSIEGFTVGGRSLPGWALGLSILATYLSSISFLANPGKSYAANWSPFVFSLTIPVVCIVASRFFIPLYRGKLQTTAYEHLEYRFGYWARAFSGMSLILLQIGRIGVVLYLVSLAVHELVGWNLAMLILVLGVLTIFYTVLGGIEAVIWTDVIQAIVLLGGAVACCGLLMVRMPVDLSDAVASAASAGKFSFGGWRFNLVMEGFWTVFLFGIVDNLRNFGVDQNYVQRFLSASSDREARKSLWFGGLLYLPVSALFFFIGTLLFLYYNALEPTPTGLPAQGDKVFPFFIVSELPIGLTGLVIAAVMAAGMSTLDSSINVSATVWTVDFYKRLIRRDAGDHQLLNMTRATTLLIGIAGTGTALLLIREQTVLDTWWIISGIFGGGMLGIFLLGILVPRASSGGAIVAVLAGILAIAWGSLSDFLPSHLLHLRFPLHKFMIGPVGAVTILVIGWLASLAAHPRHGPRR